MGQFERRNCPTRAQGKVHTASGVAANSPWVCQMYLR